MAKTTSQMKGKLDWIDFPSFIEYLIIALIYISAAFIATVSFKTSSLPFYFTLTTGLMAGVVITRGLKSLIGFTTGAILWQIILVSFPISALHLTSINSSIIILFEGVTLLIIQKSFQSNFEANSLIEQNAGLKRFFTITLIASIPQAAVFSFILSYAQGGQPNLSFLNLFQLTWLSITVSLLSLIPFLIIVLSKNKISIFEKIKFSWELALFFLLLLLPNTLEILGLVKPPYSLPIHYLVFPSIFIIALKKSIKVLSFSLFVFYIITILTSSIGHGVFSPTDNFLNASNVYYFILFFLFITFSLNVAVNEKYLAFESLKKTYCSVEDEVARQVGVFRELNSKLFEEVEQRGVVERELNESRNLLDEAQEIANIASWELNTETEEIKWSKSASKVFGVTPEELPGSLDEYRKLIHPDDLEYLNRLITDVVSAPINFETELRHTSSNNNVNYVLIRGRSFTEQGVVKRVIGLSFDITGKKELENLLSEKEEKYRALFESNIDSVSVIDPEGKTFIDVNHAFEQRYGYTKSEIIGKPYSLISAEAEETYSAIDNAYRIGSHRVRARIHKKKDGEEFYAEGIFVRFTVSGKSLIFVISQDITKRKIAERTLAEQELQYRLFFESDLIGMAEASQKKEWITFNNKFCSILGYPANELIQKTWDSLTHPDDLKREMKLYSDVIVHKNSGYSIEKRFIRKDGTPIYCKVAVKAILNPQGQITHLVKLIEDISVRKQIEKELLESRATLRRAQQIAKLGSWSWNLAYNFISLNDEAYPLLGWKKSQGPYNIKNFIELVDPEKRSLVENIIDAAKMGKKQDESIEIPIRITSSELRYILLNVGFNTGSSVDVSEVLATMADITDIKKAEVALQEANALKDQLFSIIAHDLKGPVGTITQVIAYIADETNAIDNETRNDLILSLKDTSQETYNLLENLLDWAKSQKQVSFKPEKILLKSAADTTIALLSGMASPKNITVTNSIGEDLTAYADPYMVSTVFRNLISNAIKFTPKGGTILIQGFLDDSRVIIKFIDSGIGIPKEVTDKIFNPSINYTTLGTNNEKGTGLGLKLVKKLITSNGGTISVDSTPNQGTTFTIILSA